MKGTYAFGNLRNIFPEGINEGQCMVTDHKGELMIAEYDTAANQYLVS